MTQPLLVVEGLVKHFDAIGVTDHVDLTLMRGEIHALIGPNGAGKTTLINQVTGYLPSDAGSIRLNNQAIQHWSMARRARAGIGRSFQINSLIPSFTARENVLLAVQAAVGHNFYFFKSLSQQHDLVGRADEFLNRVGVGAQADVPVSLLSYGQQRLIEVAVAMANDPLVLLLDEPLAGLGPTESESMVQLLGSLRQDYAMLLVEHDMDAVFTLADRISVLVYGKVILCDTPDVVRNSEVVRQAYLGDEDF
jgi:branched-chain amino acid transport system ATP-binding protein